MTLVTVCPYKCTSCDLNTDGVMECKTCNAKFGLSDEQCSPCPKDCVECDYDEGSMVCTKCAAKKVLVDDACQSEYQ